MEIALSSVAAWDLTVDTNLKIKSSQYQWDQDHMYRIIGFRWVRVPYIDAEQLKGASPIA